jgi:transcriptional regulator GlxA family with amidase domain
MVTGKTIKSVLVEELVQACCGNKAKEEMVEDLVVRVWHRRNNAQHLRNKAQREKIKTALQFYKENMEEAEATK